MATQNINSAAKILVNPVVLKLFKSSDLVNEIGTAINPIVFTGAIAGSTTQHPDNSFLLYNDKDGTYQSVDAKSITLEVLAMELVDELVGVSDGSINQIFTIAYAPILSQTNAEVNVLVGTELWTEVSSFVGLPNTATAFIVNYTTGAISFGNDVNGKIPPNGQQIFVSYTPNTTTFGKEAMDDGWLGVQSADTDAHDRETLLDPSVVIDLSHIQAFHIPLINSAAVSGVYLTSDPNRLGTNYFTGGAYNDTTGVITLGTPLPSGTTIALADYSYTIESDSEISYTQLSLGVVHALTNPIPSTNAKKLNLQVVIPSGASPTNGVNVKFRLRVSYTEY
jgi:hypothetical protein